MVGVRSGSLGALASLVALALGCNDPKLQATDARHVVIDLKARELVDSCSYPCARAKRPGEELARCKSGGAEWEKPTSTTPRHDLAHQLGPAVAGFAVCTFTRAAK